MSRANSIPHLWMLQKFDDVETIANLFSGPLDDVTITEKVDGVNAVFGVDDDGKVYVSREKKCGDRYYDVHSIQNSSSGAKYLLEIFFSHVSLVHDALELPAGSEAECELLYFGNTNVVRYDKFPGMVVILNHNFPPQVLWNITGLTVKVPATREHWDEFGKTSESVILECMLSPVPELSEDQKQIISRRVAEPLSDLVQRMDMCRRTFANINGLDIDEASTIKLNIGPRDTVKRRRCQRDEALEHITGFGKELFHILYHLSRVNVLPSAYATKRSPYPYPEGFVVNVPNFDTRFKLVDTARFSELNNFYHSIESQLVNKMVPKTPHPNVDLKSISQHPLNVNGNRCAYLLLTETVGGNAMRMHAQVKQIVENSVPLTRRLETFDNLEKFHSMLTSVTKEEIKSLQQNHTPVYLNSSFPAVSIRIDDDQWSRIWKTYHDLVDYCEKWLNFAAENLKHLPVASDNQEYTIPTTLTI